MIALDTNVLVRLLVRDDDAQTAIARELVTSHQTWVSRTVLLETAWVLEHRFHLDPPQVAVVLGGLLRISTVYVDDRAGFRQALAWVTAGMDVADAIHLSVRTTSGGFATFDRNLARTAASLPDAPTVRLLGSA